MINQIEPEVEFFNPDTQKWVKKLPKRFFNKLVKTRIIRTRYLRLLTYDNACKVIDFINQYDKDDYARITSGGVCMQVSDRNWIRTEAFIKSLGVSYEISLFHPEIVIKKMVDNLKSTGVI